MSSQQLWSFYWCYCHCIIFYECFSNRYKDNSYLKVKPCCDYMYRACLLCLDDELDRKQSSGDSFFFHINQTNNVFHSLTMFFLFCFSGPDSSERQWVSKLYWNKNVVNIWMVLKIILKDRFTVIYTSLLPDFVWV